MFSYAHYFIRAKCELDFIFRLLFQAKSTMCYSIVQIVENSKLSSIAVPTAWTIKEGWSYVRARHEGLRNRFDNGVDLLYWPNGSQANVRNLLADPNSVPKKSWKAVRCTIQKQGIANAADAKHYLCEGLFV